MFYIGIDPGVSGGFAVLSRGGAVVDVWKMPATERDLLERLIPYGSAVDQQAVALLEHVSASPQMGVVSAFTFGKGLGRLLMALTAAYVPFNEITPRKWQTHMQCLSGGDKNITKRRAQQLFPRQTITHAIADALLLAECCRRLARQGAFGSTATPERKDRTIDGKEGSTGKADEGQGQINFKGGRRGGKRQKENDAAPRGRSPRQGRQ